MENSKLRGSSLRVKLVFSLSSLIKNFMRPRIISVADFASHLERNSDNDNPLFSTDYRNTYLAKSLIP